MRAVSVNDSTFEKFRMAINYVIGYFVLVHHTHLVARPLAEIISKYDLMELHVSLTNGLWRYESWGYPVGKFPLLNFDLNPKLIRHKYLFLS